MRIMKKTILALSIGIVFNLIILGLLDQSAAIANDDVNRTYSVNSITCRDLFLVPVILTPREKTQGTSESERTLWFIYDTGASATFVDPDSLQRASGVRVAIGKRAIIRGARAGDVTFNKLPARVLELDHLALGMGRPIDGLMAVDSFKDFLLHLDYQAGRITLTKGALESADEQFVFSSKGRDKRPWLSIKVGDSREKILIDSGSAGGFSLSKLSGYHLKAPPVYVSSSIRLREIFDKKGARLSEDISFGDIRFPTPSASDASKAPLFGSQLMKSFRWTFDLRRKRMRIEPVSERIIPTPPIYSMGFAIRPSKGDFVVDKVRARGAADKAGFQSGDRLTAVDGKAIGERGCKSLVDQSGADVSVIRDGQELVLRMQPEVVVE